MLTLADGDDYVVTLRYHAMIADDGSITVSFFELSFDCAQTTRAVKRK